MLHEDFIPMEWRVRILSVTVHRYSQNTFLQCPTTLCLMCNGLSSAGILYLFLIKLRYPPRSFFFWSGSHYLLCNIVCHWSPRHEWESYMKAHRSSAYTSMVTWVLPVMCHSLNTRAGEVIFNQADPNQTLLKIEISGFSITKYFEGHLLYLSILEFRSGLVLRKPTLFLCH